MPDLLIVSRDSEKTFQLEELALKHGFRSKSSLELKTALDWLNLRSFQVVLIDHAVAIKDQQKVAGLLWEKNPLALFIVYDLESGTKRPHREARLFGADVACGEKALEQIGKLLISALEQAKSNKQLCADDFRVMVVEDLDSPRDIISMYVESLGFPLVSGFSSAKSAIAELEANPTAYSCILTDIRMPEMSGKDLITAVRQDTKLAHLPVIVLTAYGTVDCLLDCLVAGATGFLIKPPKKKDLAWELQRAMRVLAHGHNPRLSSPEEAEEMRNLLMDRGFM